MHDVNNLLVYKTAKISSTNMWTGKIYWTVNLILTSVAFGNVQRWVTCSYIWYNSLNRIWRHWFIEYSEITESKYNTRKICSRESTRNLIFPGDWVCKTDPQHHSNWFWSDCRKFHNVRTRPLLVKPRKSTCPMTSPGHWEEPISSVIETIKIPVHIGNILRKLTARYNSMSTLNWRTNWSFCCLKRSLFYLPHLSFL